MGTRNLTIVVYGGKTRIAQYGQWDGYPSGQGKTVLEFLHNLKDKRKFKRHLEKCRFISDEEFDVLWEGTTGTQNALFVPIQTSKSFGEVYPQLSRDLGAGVLNYVLNTKGAIYLQDATDFQGNFSCEWAYKIDLDQNLFTVYNGREALKTYRIARDTLPSLQQFYDDLTG